MKIQPNPGGRSPAQSDRVTRGATRRGSDARGADGASRPGTSGADDVQISAEARDLAPASANAPEPSLAADRLREVLDRVAGGFYDQPEVVDTVLQRLRKDL